MTSLFVFVVGSNVYVVKIKVKSIRRVEWGVGLVLVSILADFCKFWLCVVEYGVLQYYCFLLLNVTTVSLKRIEGNEKFSLQHQATQKCARKITIFSSRMYITLFYVSLNNIYQFDS